MTYIKTSFFLLVFFLLFNIPHVSGENQVDIPKIQKDFMTLLSNIPSFQANFFQRRSQDSKPSAQGVFYFDKKHKFKLRYEEGAIPYEFTFDGKWLAQDDRDLEQVSYVHKEDFPIAHLFDNPKELEKRIKTVRLRSGKSHYIVYDVKIKDYEQPVSIFFDKNTKMLSGWALRHQDGSKVFLSLHTYIFNPDFKDSLFRLPSSKKYK